MNGVTDIFGHYLKFLNRVEHSVNLLQVGESSIKFIAAKNRSENMYWKNLKENLSEMADFCWPDRSADAELASLMLQTAKHEDIAKPDQSTLDDVTNRMLPRYIRYDLHESCREFNEDIIRARLEKLVDNVNPDASPGLPWAALAKSNAKLFEGHREMVITSTIARIRLLSEIDSVNLYCMSPEERVLRGYNDPARMFVKDEPHKVEKVKEGRNRIIMSVSIVDKLIQMYMRKFIHDLEIENWQSQPNKPGIGFTPVLTAWMWKHVRENYNISSDVSGFDFSYQEWSKEFEVDFKIKLCRNPSDFWIKLMHNSRICLSNIILSTSDGRLFLLTWRGLMLSGEYITGNCNSTVRNFDAALVGADPSESMGDDCVETEISNPKEKYAKIGLKVKVYDKIGDEFEFCSRVFSGDKSYLVNGVKLMMNFVHSDVSTSAKYRAQLRAFENDMGSSPRFAEYMHELERVGFLRPEWLDEEIRVEDAKY